MKPGEHQTIGFDECLRKARSDGSLQFITEDQVLQLRALNGLRDAAQHYMIDLSEQHLYIHAQAGVTLFREVLHEVFDEALNVQLPPRVLPLSTTPPTDLIAVFEQETKEVKRLLGMGKAQLVRANAKLRGLAIVDGAMRGGHDQPNDHELIKHGKTISKDGDWHALFPGVAQIRLTAKGFGPSLDLRISKKEGMQIKLASDDPPGSHVLAVRKIDSLGFYNLGRNQVAKHLKLTGPKTTALIWYLKIKDDSECFRQVRIGKSKFDRYSQATIRRLREALENVDINEVWSKYKNRPK